MGDCGSKVEESEKENPNELSESTIELLMQSTNLSKPTIITWHKQFLVKKKKF